MSLYTVRDKSMTTPKKKKIKLYCDYLACQEKSWMACELRSLVNFDNDIRRYMYIEGMYTCV